MSDLKKKVHAFQDDALGELDALGIADRIKKKENECNNTCIH